MNGNGQFSRLNTMEKIRKWLSTLHQNIFDLFSFYFLFSQNSIFCLFLSCFFYQVTFFLLYTAFISVSNHFLLKMNALSFVNGIGCKSFLTKCNSCLSLGYLQEQGIVNDPKRNSYVRNHTLFFQLLFV